MTTSAGTLAYFGPEQASNRTLGGRCWRLLVNLALLLILLIAVTLRAAVLLAGFACVFAGTLLLTLGGRRSAAQKLAQWQSRAGELLRLWIADILRPLRRARQRSPLPVLPA